MKSFLLYGKKDIRFCEIPYPETSSNEVVVKIKSVGICGSDVHYYKDGKIGDFIPKAPFALGHELVGIIDRESSQSPHLKKGTKVSINPSRPCKECTECRRGAFNLCPFMKYIGSASVFPHINGGFSKYIKIPAENCIPLSDSISLEAAALLEPISVVLQAISKVGDLKGKSILITGAGTIGQLCLMVASLYSSMPIVITDIRNTALTMSKNLGATAAINPDDPGFRTHLLEIAPNGFDVLLEAFGAPNILNHNVNYLKKGGKVVQSGMFSERAQFPFAEFMKKELMFLPSFRFNTEYSLAVVLLGEKKLDLTEIITDRFPFDKIPQAIKKASHSLEDIKIIIEN